MGEVYRQANTANEPSEFITAVGRSRLFTLLCGSLQFTILVGAVLIFYFDAWTIGYLRGANWRLVTVAIGLYTLSSWFWIAALGPYSRLGGKMSK